MARARKHWGWGYADEQPTAAVLDASAAFLREHLGFGSADVESPAPLPELPPPRLTPPRSLGAHLSSEPHARAFHAHGASYRDVVRGFRGQFDHVPDAVAFPSDERQLADLLDWAISAGAAVIPFGGGTSVVGGVEPAGIDTPVLTVAMSGMDRVVEVDDVSLAACIEAGASGPRLEEQLAEHGLTLRHYPQSFQFQTLGGAIATRAGGHYATGPTHIDDFVESIRCLTPAGWWESRRLPASGAGPSPDRMLLGSEGTFGVISSAWVRVMRKPTFRASATVRFPSFLAGAAGARAVVQSGLRPANLRLIDPDEARLTFAGDGSAALLLVSFESADHPVDRLLATALARCAEHAGERAERRGQSSAADTWRDSFFRAPYLRDTFVAIGVLSETFETAITWDRFDAFVASVLEATRAAVRATCGAGSVTCRLTHVYADGAAPYFTILAPARRGSELAQWAEIKAAASEAVLAGGGTITHHHAVGRDHAPWYRRQIPAPFAAALAAAKHAVDPTGAMNPGVLL